MGQAASRWAKALLERPEERQRLSASHSMERCMGGCLLLLLVSLITPMLAQEYQCDPTPNGLSDNCIGCICEASTRCNATTKCISGGSFCGPFLLSKPFWVDGGSCVLEGDSPSDQGGGFDFLLGVGVGDGGQGGGFYLQHDDFFSSCVIIFFSLETMC